MLVGEVAKQEELRLLLVELLLSSQLSGRGKKTFAACASGRRWVGCCERIGGGYRGCLEVELSSFDMRGEEEKRG